MSDANDNAQNGNEQQQMTISSKIIELTKALGDVDGMLRAQYEALATRNVRLPSGVLDNMRTLRRNLEALQRSATSTGMELRSLRALAENTSVVNSALDPDEVLNHVIDTVIALTGAERGYIVLKDETGDLVFRVARGMDANQLDSSKGLIISKTIVNQVADTGEAILTDNASDDERFQQQASIMSNQLRSILAVPLKIRDEVIGVVYCDNKVFAGLFKESDLDMLEAFANQAAVAIDNANLFEATRQRLSEVSEMRDRMTNIFTSVTNGIVTLDPDDNILITNAAFEQMVGGEDLAGQSLTDTIPNMPDALTTAIQQVRQDKVQIKLELDFEHGDMGERIWNVIASPLMDEVGGLSESITIVVDDLTEQRRSESQVQETRRYLPSALVENFKDSDFLNVAVEEREITALFADVRGFTSFSEKLEPEELMRVINKYLAIASDSINLFEGIVDKYMGDAVTGLWNTQLNPQPDHAIRAVQSAMQLVLDLYAQHEVMPEDERLFYGIGIHTGESVLGNVGGAERKEFAALGAATDICKYLQEQAGAGEVVISESTYEAVKHTFECEPVTEVARPKQDYEDVKMYRVVRRKKGSTTGSLFIDQELLDLLGGDDD
jgi:adenylate cyclase